MKSLPPNERPVITQELLRERFNYDPLTGIFTYRHDWWKKKVGDLAGFVSKEGYAFLYLNGRNVLAHRMAWLYVHGFIPDYIDHINGVRTDNALSNLRSATKRQNSQNTKVKKNTRTGKKGVRTLLRTPGYWQARIRVSGKDVFLGSYRSPDEAAHAYNKAAILHHGDFAVLNPIGEDKT